jgi:capsule polysaccharide export protein KpsE/RkpR
MSHAASLPVDMPSAILDRLRRIDESGRAVIRWANTNFVAPTAGKFQRASAQIQLRLLANGAMRNIAKQTSYTLETLIWLRGMKATIEEWDDDSAARVGELLPSIESLQETMQGLRGTMVRFKDSIASATKSPSLRTQRIAAFHKYLAAQTDAYAALEAARWAVLEREADTDIAAGRIGQTFTSAADMMASLDR